MRYGVCYQGSKNFIAQWIVNLLPKKKHFYDLFAGGCAVTHCAMLNKKFDDYYINDICDIVQLFYDALNGKYKDECRWISREEFFAQKDNDPYIRYVWSFGNNGTSYIYSKEIEPLRKIQWDICFSKTHYERKLLLRHYAQCLFDSGLLLVKPESDGRRNCTKLKENLSKIFGENSINKISISADAIKANQSMQRLNHLQMIETSIRNIQQVQSLERLDDLINMKMNIPLQMSIGDYRDVKIKDDAVIYCDIPYKNTCGYNEDRKKISNFDYDAFYDWCEKQTQPLFISEYWMPENRFECIAQKSKVLGQQVGEKRKYTTEKLFIPRTQKYKKEGELF